MGGAEQHNAQHHAAPHEVENSDAVTDAWFRFPLLQAAFSIAKGGDSAQWFLRK